MYELGEERQESSQ